MNRNDIVEEIEKLNDKIREKDPLIKRGIQRDWVCIIHPRILYGLQREMPEKVINDFTVQYITGRPTYVLNEAPLDKIEYMPREMAHIRYPGFFLLGIKYESP